MTQIVFLQELAEKSKHIEQLKLVDARHRPNHHYALPQQQQTTTFNNRPAAYIRPAMHEPTTTIVQTNGHIPTKSALQATLM